MTRPIPEGRLLEVDSGEACVGSRGVYSLRLRFWHGGEKGRVDFLDLPLSPDPLEVEKKLALPQTPDFWKAFQMARVLSPEHEEILQGAVPIVGSVVRACFLRVHRDHAATGPRRKTPRLERAASWALVQRLGGIAVPPESVLMDHRGLGCTWLLEEGGSKEKERVVVEGDPTSLEWLESRHTREQKAYVVLTESVMPGLHVVLHPRLTPELQSDGDSPMVERLVFDGHVSELTAPNGHQG